jgi:hypothetical protein
MKYTYEDLEEIADRTGHDCHLCHLPIEFDAYADKKHPDRWEVDHVRPKSKGGHNGPSNLRAAHSYCNRKKGNRSNRSIRAKFGVKGMPPSTSTKIWRGVGYVALGAGALWVLTQIFKPKTKPLSTGSR